MPWMLSPRQGEWCGRGIGVCGVGVALGCVMGAWHWGV